VHDLSAAAVSQDSIIVFGGVRNSCGVQEPLNDLWMYNLKHFRWHCITAKTDDMHDPAGKVQTSITLPPFHFFDCSVQNVSAPSHRFSSACAFDALGWNFALLHGGTKPILVCSIAVLAARMQNSLRFALYNIFLKFTCFLLILTF
jgi:hypothetical protein